MARKRNPISSTRGALYGLARALGWLQIALELLTGNARRAQKKLANKLIGRKIGSKIYFK